MDRRSFLTGALAWGVAGKALAEYHTSPGLPASPTDTVVLQLINFFCSRCKAVNDQHSRLFRTARSVGLDFRVAPAASERQSIWPDRVYYATRDTHPELENFVRNALFDGIHKDGMAFEDLPQVMSYLEGRGIITTGAQLYSNFDLSKIAEYANTDTPLISGAKAVRLIEASGAEEFPIFLWISQGEILQAITTYNASEPLRLTMMVVNAMKNPVS